MADPDAEKKPDTFKEQERQKEGALRGASCEDGDPPAAAAPAVGGNVPVAMKEKEAQTQLKGARAADGAVDLDLVVVCRKLQIPEEIVIVNYPEQRLRDSLLILGYALSQCGEYIYCHQDDFIPEQPAADGSKSTIRLDAPNTIDLLGGQTAYKEIMDKLGWTSSVKSHQIFEQWRHYYVVNGTDDIWRVVKNQKRPAPVKIGQQPFVQCHIWTQGWEGLADASDMKRRNAEWCALTDNPNIIVERLWPGLRDSIHNIGKFLKALREVSYCLFVF